VHGIEVDAAGDYWMRAVIETNGNGKRAKGKNSPPNSAPPVKRKRKAGAKGPKGELTPLDSTLNEQR
jgi:arginine decarboxylase